MHQFAMYFTSTPRGARLARRLVSHRLNAWGHAYTDPVNETLTLLAAELTANAVRHGHRAGSDFHVSLVRTGADTFRIEVSDTRDERPPGGARPPAGPDDESGRGLLLVAALADAWGCAPRADGTGKTVWATTGGRPGSGATARQGLVKAPGPVRDADRRR
ncbi:ATP-binding protein [Streptomyces sp. NPDC049813]|uniref:ATP-binding protein n=1 Tax=Streptomyces sp. NPDC049813 TaxID=3365597 RepID=UPI0037ABAC1A